MYNAILIRYGEIALKGKNRSLFVNQLIDNIKNSIKDLGQHKIKRTFGRIYVYPENDSEKLIKRIKWIPGIVSLSPVISTELNFENLKTKALELFQQEVTDYPTTFKVETNRANKDFPKISPEINSEIGAYILKNIDNELTVDVHKPEIRLSIEVREEKIYINTRVIQGPGGLPIGTGGKGLLLLSGGIDSPVAGWMGMKRGLKIEALYFHSFPFTSDRAKEKVIDLVKILSQYGGEIKLYINHFTEIQKAIQEKCPDEDRITIMRRFMFEIATHIAHNNNDLALLTGEAIGQVASQTLESMSVINAVTNIPVLRPLIAMDKNDIIDIAKKIGTYQTSIQPYEDCCTVFVPDSPRTKPQLEQTIRAESNLNRKELIAGAVEKTEVKFIKSENHLTK